MIKLGSESDSFLLVPSKSNGSPQRAWNIPSANSLFESFLSGMCSPALDDSCLVEPEFIWIASGDRCSKTCWRFPNPLPRGRCHLSRQKW